MNRRCGLLVNASRSILFAGKAAVEAERLQQQMEILLEEAGII
jgi:hypothetical protein